MKIPKSCLECGTTENLDTSMTIRLHGKEYKVWFCDQHDDVSAKAAKEKLINTLNIIDEISEEAEKYGMIVVSKEEYEQLTSDSKSAVDARQDKISSNIESKELTIETRKQRAPSATGDVAGTSLEEHDSYVVGRASDAKVENNSVKLKNGREVVVPSKIKGSDGNSEIRIIEGVDDSILQNTTNRLSQKSNQPGFKGAKYGSDCTSCRGAGIHPITKQECPKCGGTGVLMS